MSIRRRLVSVVMPTRDAEATLGDAIESIKNQTYPSIEIIVVDNGSVDATVAIARRQGCVVIETNASERCAQLNIGIRHAVGEFIYRVDADFVLAPDVIEQAVRCCVDGSDAVIIHNSSDGTLSSWARVRQFERDMYVGDGLNVAARFIRTDLLRKIGGFDEELVAGEDYDVHVRLVRVGARFGRVDRGEVHIGEPRTLREVWRKHWYYGRTLRPYVSKHGWLAVRQLSPARPAILRNWRSFVVEWRLIPAFVVYQLVKYSAGLCGMSTPSSPRSRALRISSRQRSWRR
jgi:glycosyltransferase involved in cell wall biosynthesis